MKGVRYIIGSHFICSNKRTFLLLFFDMKVTINKKQHVINMNTTFSLIFHFLSEEDANVQRFNLLLISIKCVLIICVCVRVCMDERGCKETLCTYIQCDKKKIKRKNIVIMCGPSKGGQHTTNSNDASLILTLYYVCMCVCVFVNKISEIVTVRLYRLKPTPAKMARAARIY